MIDGKASFLILAASKAISPLIRGCPKRSPRRSTKRPASSTTIRRRAAEIYLVHEPSTTLDAAAIAGVLSGLKDEFGSAVRGIGAFADFMGRHGELKSPPQAGRRSSRRRC